MIFRAPHDRERPSDISAKSPPIRTPETTPCEIRSTLVLSSSGFERAYLGRPGGSEAGQGSFRFYSSGE
jgi:hypothetical protein